MAIIEFQNIETLEAFKPILQELEAEKTAQQKRATEIKHGLVLLKAGLYWGGIE